MAQDAPQPQDTLYQNYGRNLYKLTGNEMENDILNIALNADSGSNNSSAVEMNVANLGSGTAVVTTGQAAGALKAGQATFNDANPGYFLGVLNGQGVFSLRGVSSYLYFDGTNFNVKVANSNLQIYQSVVDAAGNGDYTTVAAALAAGKTSIYVRNGTYNSEPKWTISTAETIIEGESVGGVVINFASGAGGVNIAFGANGIQLRGMSLYAYSAQTLVQNASTRGVVDNCFLQALSGTVINSIDAMTVKDCYVSALSNNAGSWAFADSCSNCLFSNCVVDMGASTGTSTPVTGGGKNIFSQCRFLATGNKVSVYSADIQTLFTNCYFSSFKYTLSGNFQNCTINGNGYATLATQAFINVSTFPTRLINNVINTNDSAGEGIIYILAYNCVFDGNYVKDIHQIYMGPGTNIYCVSLQNNEIISKIAAGSALTLTISSDIHYSNIIGNILRNNNSGDTPVITNGGGVTNNVSGNIVITV